MSDPFKSDGWRKCRREGRECCYRRCSSQRRRGGEPRQILEKTGPAKIDLPHTLVSGQTTILQTASRGLRKECREDRTRARL